MRVVVLDDKNGNLSIYKTLTKLVKENSNIGICLGALYNALSKGDGKYENKKVRIYYKYMQ
jgi:hypothetical protein